MSAFSTAFSAAIQDQELTQVEAAALCRVDQSQLSRLLSGKLAPTRKVLRGIFDGFRSRDRSVAEGIVAAHLRDEAQAAGMNPREFDITLASACSSDDTVRVPPELREAFEWMAHAAIYPEVAAFIRSNGQLCKMHFASMADSARLEELHGKGAVYPFQQDKPALKAAEDPRASFATEAGDLPADQALADEKARRARLRDSKTAS